jgi:hypothetical protein
MNKKEGGKSHQGCRREKICHRLSPIYYTSIAIFKDFDQDRSQARTVIKGIDKKNTIGDGRFCLILLQRDVMLPRWPISWIY